MRGISNKPVDQTDIYEAMNRELIPLLREMRQALLDLQTAGGPTQDHGDTHHSGGIDEIAGELLNIDLTPENYTAGQDRLDSHLDGIDEALSPYLVYVTAPAAHAFTLGDAFKTIDCTHGSPTSHTIPLNATIPYPIGTVIRFLWSGVGQPTIAAAGTLIAPDGAKVSAVNKFVFAEQKSADVWLLSGSCAA